MDCQEAKEKLLESFDGGLSADDSRQLARHLCACPNCAGFGELLKTLDLQLKEAITSPRLSPGFRAALRSRIDRQPRRLWTHWLPDVAYFAASGAAILWCVVLLPFPASAVLWIGALTAATGYSFQALLLSSLEEL